jgi:hypothetical protein
MRVHDPVIGVGPCTRDAHFHTGSAIDSYELAVLQIFLLQVYYSTFLLNTLNNGKKVT